MCAPTFCFKKLLRERHGRSESAPTTFYFLITENYSLLTTYHSLLDDRSELYAVQGGFYGVGEHIEFRHQ